MSFDQSDKGKYKCIINVSYQCTNIDPDAMDRVIGKNILVPTYETHYHYNILQSFKYLPPVFFFRFSPDLMLMTVTQRALCPMQAKIFLRGSSRLTTLRKKKTVRNTNKNHSHLSLQLANFSYFIKTNRLPISHVYP